MLLCASTAFNMVLIPKCLLILVFLIPVDYLAGIVIERAHGGKRKLFLNIILIANVGTLALFKYFNFFNSRLGNSKPFLSALVLLNPLSSRLSIT